MADTMIVITGSTDSPIQGKIMNQVQGPTWEPKQEMRPETGLEIIIES